MFRILIFVSLFILSSCISHRNQNIGIGDFNQLKSSQAEKEVYKSETNLIRKAAKAGTWYPALKSQLKEEINNFLSQVPELNVEKKPRIIISPHPGIEFGGQVAAYSYKAISKFKYHNVFLIGVTHTSDFTGISVGDYNAYETPLGNVKVNRDITSFLLKKDFKIKFDPNVHKDEHSNEMQLPFLQTVLDDFQIVPIILSAYQNDDPEYLAQLLYQVITPDDLVVISTDLSHYPTYDDANKYDKKTLEAILTLNINEYRKDMKKLEMNPPKNILTFICGERALLVALLLSEKLNLKKADILHYENSGDRPIGDKNQVVGYGSVAIYSSNEESFSDTIFLSIKEKKLALKIARETLENYFSGKEYKFTVSENSYLMKNLGVFVTLKKNKNLRGCIGNFEPNIPLYQVIQNVALDAAFKDYRFPKLNETELSDIEIEISILSPRKLITIPEEIIPGKHGVYVSKGILSGTYLPQVASEQGWDRETMMNSLCEQKSGIYKNAWRDGSTNMYIYTALVFSENDFAI